MCYKVKCSTCGKTGWAGCGRHVSSVYKSIPDGQHCQCREWPGINRADGTAVGDAGQPSSVCSIL